MISDSQTRYGSARSPGSGRHGSRRRWRSYHSSSRAGRAVASEASPRRLVLAIAGEFMKADSYPDANLSVMPALVAGIHVFLRAPVQDVDGRDEPGHDD